jgi:glucose-6-phosphate isomerase
MNISKNIYLKSFKYKKSNQKILKIFLKLIEEKSQIISSLGEYYKNSYSKNFVSKFKKFSKIILIGMGGSSLGAKAIYSFMRPKVKKKFTFLDNLDSMKCIQKKKKSKLKYNNFKVRKYS